MFVQYVLVRDGTQVYNALTRSVLPLNRSKSDFLSSQTGWAGQEVIIASDETHEN